MSYWLLVYLFFTCVLVCVVTDSSVTLPEWFRLLLTCSCHVTNFQVQSCAISTVFDLLSLAQSVDLEPQSKVAGKVSVVIVPPISFQQLAFVENNTKFYQVSKFFE